MALLDSEAFPTGGAFKEYPGHFPWYTRRSMVDSDSAGDCRVYGRYALHAEVAHGGMATVHVGRLLGTAGFCRTVAIKKLHPFFAKDPEFVAMFMDEARLAARIQHPNVVSILDVVAVQGELLLIMDYVHGESFARLLSASRRAGAMPAPRVVTKVLSDVLGGLHAAHEARNERGMPLGVVHRDLSPQNVLVGVDGVSLLIDFGVAKAADRIQTTREGQLKGKIAYMAPEQIRGGPVDRRTDIYAASVVLWEALAGRRLFTGDGAALMYEVLEATVPPPGRYVAGLPEALDAMVLKGLSRDPDQRFCNANEMADALERALPPASSRDVARWVEQVVGPVLQERARHVVEVESSPELERSPSPESPAPDLPPTGTPPSQMPSSGPSEPVSSGEAAVTAATFSSAPTLPRAHRSKRIWLAPAILAAVLVASTAWLLGPGRSDQRLPSAASSSANPWTPSAPAASSGQTVPLPTDSVQGLASQSPASNAMVGEAKPPGSQTMPGLGTSRRDAGSKSKRRDKYGF